MNLRQAMRALADDLDHLAIDFRRALLDEDLPPKQLLLDFQRRLDQARRCFWDTRKLCDPFLVSSRPGDPQPPAASLAERVVRLIDEQQPARRRSS